MGKLGTWGNSETVQLEILPIGINPLEIEYSQISTRFDPEYGVLWTEMNPEGIPCCSRKLLDELDHHQRILEKCGGKIQAGDQLHPVRYAVAASLTPGVFNLGGDLELFSLLIKNQDRQALLKYSIKCLDVIFSRTSHYNFPLITISLVQGDALGGGLEAALASDVIIAERGAKMGFPEMLFNLIPGHGAFSLTARKIGVANAEKMILSGKIYSAAELHELGLVDVLVEDGEGVEAVRDYAAKRSRCSNGYMALLKARHRFNPVTYQEMLDITNIWVDAALQLSVKDLKVMDRILRSQQKYYGKSEAVKQSGEAVQNAAVTRRKTEISLVL
ncbi:MAG: crotonase/enoyl-CoA hydratase family protein [Gallionella sp.]